MRTMLLSIAFLAAPLAAQTQTAPVQSDAAHDAISAGTQPSTAAANATIAGDVNARTAAVDAVNLDGEARYAADMAAWLDARRIAAADGRQYLRQQRAYADAMAAWRAQVDACNRGRTAACKAPTPDPAAFY